jgi:hypothetical protein
MAAAALLLSVGGAAAQSSYYGVSPFEGFYAGGYAGGMINSDSAGSLGVVAGVNFAVSDGVLLGAEAQGGATFGSSTSYDTLMLGHIGYQTDSQVMVYGALGTGVIDGTGSYAMGGGAEAIVTNQVGVRGEILGTGPWGSTMNSVKATAGVLWHVQ